MRRSKKPLSPLRFTRRTKFCARSAEVGLTVNTSKCELIPHVCCPKEELREVGFTFDEGGQDVMGEGGFRLLDVDGFDFLGIPIGSAEFCEEYMARKVDKSRRNLEALVDLEDTQAAFYVLRYCEGFCRMVFYMRGIPHGAVVERRPPPAPDQRAGVEVRFN